MSHDDAALEVLSALSRVMQSWGDRWYLFGAQAALIWGRPRTSADVDVTAKLDLADLTGFVQAMGKAGFVLRVDDFESFVARTRVLPFLHEPTQLPLDIVLAGPGLEEEFLERAVQVSMQGLTIPVISPEDLILTKMLAGRPKDLEDVRGILRERHAALDLERIRSILSLLEQALSQSDLIPAFENLLDAARRR